MFKYLFYYLSLGVWLFNLQAVEVVKTAFDTPDLVLAEIVLEPADNPSEECSLRLQTAIDIVAAKGGGTVFLCGGYYKLATPIVVKEGVTLRGDHPHDYHDAAKSTVLCVFAGRGEAEGTPAVTIERGSGLRGLTFWYPEQSASKPVEYPWTVFVSEKVRGNNQSVFDCLFVNSWRALCIGPASNELHTLRRVKICALKTGVFIDGTTDIGRLSELSISPTFWIESALPGAPKGSGADAFREWMLDSESRGLIIGRSDWEYIWRLKVDGYNRGVVFQKGERGTTNAVMAESDLTSCKTALYIEALNHVGLSLYDCRLHGLEYSAQTSRGFENIVQFHSCAFTGAIKKDGQGVFSFKRCSMSNVSVHSGEVLICDCVFTKAVLGEKVQRARIIGFDRSKCVVENFSEGGDVAIVSKRMDKVEFVKIAHQPAVIPRLNSNTVFVVTSFGASVKLEDNAEAFQKALDAAGQSKGGGTVYVPAGYYRFQNDITVPGGVELRGCFDVPHHTISDGSVLMPRHNAGQEDGPAFVKLSSGSGLRGVSFWYPEQPLSAPVAYPWCVQSQGQECWVVDTNIGNAWQGVDFLTYRSDGHVIQYLSGAMFKRGLFVGNNNKRGWVEDVQLNPHYMGRRSKTLPYVSGPGWKNDSRNLIEYQRKHLKGIVFRNCRMENVRGTFLYAAHEGIAFYGKCDAWVLMHGSDTVSRAVYLNTDSGSELQFALAQLVSLGKFTEGAFVSSAADRGSALFQNSQIWAGDSTALLNGKGIVKLEQFNSSSGAITVNGGNLRMELGVFTKPLSEQLIVNNDAVASAIACVNRSGPFRVGGDSLSVRLSVNSNTPHKEPPVIEKGGSNAESVDGE